jgi:hypothetical protein
MFADNRMDEWTKASSHRMERYAGVKTDVPQAHTRAGMSLMNKTVWWG